jgi:hypothetical protein
MDWKRQGEFPNSLARKKIGNSRSNEYDLEGKRIVIKCARATTNSVGVPYHMLKRLDVVIGCFETKAGSYELYEMTPEMYAKNMRPTPSKGASSGRVGIVRRSTFINKCKRIKTIKL